MIRIPRLAGLALLAALASPALAAEVAVGGYAKLDLIWTNRIMGGGNGGTGEIAGGPSAVPLDGDLAAKHDDTAVSARQSRINVSGKAEVEGVKVQGFVEADFHSSDGSSYVSNSRHFRLRHAWGKATFGNGLFVQGGQTWTTFMDIETFYDTIDFNGPAGQLFARQPQLRVGYQSGEWTVAVAAEQSSVLGLSAGQLAQSQPLPLLAAKVVFAPKLGTFIAGAAATQNRAVNTTATTSDSLTATAWGVHAGLAVPVPGTPLTVKGNVNHMVGLSRLGNGDFGDALVVASKLENLETTGFYAGGNLQATATTTLSAFYGWRKAKAQLASAGEDQTQQSFHANVVQKLWGPTECGLEYQYAARKQFDGLKGALSRVQGAFYYYF